MQGHHTYFLKENFRRGSDSIRNINMKYNCAKYIQDPTKELRHITNSCKPLQDENNRALISSLHSEDLILL
jgi:hypothetical protein